jgi:arylsulfatase A-like enzyme
MCVQMAALDQSLGAFFAHLDQIGVPYLVVLTADHGSVDIPERLGPPAQRVDAAKTLGELTAYLRQTQNLSYDPFLGDDPRQLILGLAPDDDRRRPEITRAVVEWLRKRPEIAQAYTAAEIAAAVPPRSKAVEQLTLAERLNESFVPARNGDIIVVWAEGATPYAPRILGDTVAGHGSPWDYDRRVPILVWWPGVTATAEAASMETVDIAPTLAPILGVTVPADLDGRCVDIGQVCGR